MTITFQLCNVTYNQIDVVMLRKFFQMVFVGKSRKSLVIYTATVLGGGEEKEQEKDGKEFGKTKSGSKTRYMSSLDRLHQFCMQFDIIVTGNDANDVMSISNEDVTSAPGKSGFLEQEYCIQQIWGKQCRVLDNNTTEKELEDRYRNFMGNEISIDSLEREKLSQMAQQNVLWIQDDNKEKRLEMSSIAVMGQFRTNDFVPQKGERHSKLLNEGSEKSYYQIKVPDNREVCKGVELVNWVKTTIRFKDRLNDQNLNFCINKNPTDLTQYIAPDFTWYFSPPLKSFINHESSSAEVKWQRKDRNNSQCGLHSVCKCPIKPEANVPITSKRYDNAINPVANKTTVNFRMWTDKEEIGSRQKYRIAAKNILPTPESFDDVRELNIYIDTADEHNRGNRQYILGIFISFALAFGINSDLVAEAQCFFPFEKLFAADTWWLFMVVFLTLNLLIHPVRNVRKRRQRYWRRANIILTLLWTFFVFCVARSVWIGGLISQRVVIPLSNWLDGWIKIQVNLLGVPRVLFFGLFLSNIGYALWNIIRYKDPVLSGIFGENIL